jgi:4-amino-4-deoxy-L-arabinose transferase-like glycosyltransferase
VSAPTIRSDLEPRRIVFLRCLVGVLGLGVLAWYVRRFPVGFAPAVSPGWPEAAKVVSALGSIATLLLLDLAAVAIGWPLLRRLAARGRADDLALPASVGLGLLVISYIVLLWSALGLLQRSVLLATLIVPIAVQARTLVRAARERLGSRAAVRAPGVLGLVGALLALSFLLRAFIPVYGWDDYTYHLAIPERYLFSNGIWVSPFSIFSVSPHLVEMLYTLALGVDGPSLAKLINVQFGLLAGLVAYRLGARRSRRTGLVAALLLVCDPLFQFELTTAYADLALCFYALLAAAALAQWWEAPERALLWRCGVFAGACVATKYTGGAVPLALALVLLIPSGVTRLRSRFEGAVVVAGCSALLLAPWLVRNWVFAGNPVSPLFQGLFHGAGREYFDPVAVEQVLEFTHGIGMGRSLSAFLALPWNLTMETTPGVYRKSFGFQIGPLYFVALLAALLSVSARRPPWMARLLALGGVLTLIWFVHEQEARLLLPALALFAVAGAAAIDDLAGGPSSWGRLLLALPLCAAGYGLWYGAYDIAWEYGYALGRLPRAQLEAQEPAAAAGDVLRREMKHGDRALLIFESRGYYFHGLDYIPAVLHEGSGVLQMIHRESDTKSLRCRLEGLGVSHVVFNAGALARFRPIFVEGYRQPELEKDVARVRKMLSESGVPIWTSNGMSVVRLRPVSDCGGAGEAAGGRTSPLDRPAPPTVLALIRTR